MLCFIDPNAPQAVPYPDLTQERLQSALSSIRTQNETFKHPSQRSTQTVRILPARISANAGLSAQEATLTQGVYTPQEQQPQQARSMDFGAPSSLVRGTSSQDLGPQSAFQYEFDRADQSSTQVNTQEVTQYCPHTPCTWTSFKTNDPAYLRTCFDQLVLHLRTVHDDIDMSAEFRPRAGNKGSQEYKAATKPRSIIRSVDDACQNLCEARFFSFPTDLKTVGMNMPVSASPVMSTLDLSYVGVNVMTIRPSF